MKTIAFTLLIAFVLSPPRGTQNKAADGTQNNARTDHDTSQSLPATIVKPDAPKRDQEQTGTVANTNPQERVIFPTPVPINSTKDVWDHLLVIFTGLVVVVGGFQIWFLWATVKATADNAQAAKEGAEAANANARAVESQNQTLRETLAFIERQTAAAEDSLRLMKQKERAVISVDFGESRVKANPLPRYPDGALLTLGIKVFNSGLTKADIAGASVGLAYSEGPEVADPNTMSWHSIELPRVIQPSQEGVSATPARLLTIGISELSAGKLISVAVVVRYKDTFGERHTYRTQDIWCPTTEILRDAPIEGIWIAERRQEEDEPDKDTTPNR